MKRLQSWSLQVCVRNKGGRALKLPCRAALKLCQLNYNPAPSAHLRLSPTGFLAHNKPSRTPLAAAAPPKLLAPCAQPAARQKLVAMEEAATQQAGLAKLRDEVRKGVG